MLLPITLNHLPGRKSRRQIPARYWPWDNRGRIRAWKKSPRLQGDNTHIEGEGQFLWDYQCRRCCWHPNSAPPACGGIDLQGQRQRGNPGGHPPNKVFWNGEPGVTDTEILFVKQYIFNHPTSYSSYLGTTHTTVKGHLSPWQTRVSEGGGEAGLPAMGQWKMQECVPQFPL